MNLYDVLAGQGTTHFERLFARYVGGGNVQTITGIPPLTFKADGKPLTAWSIAGNMTQTGTPTPDAPIMPEFVGVRTGNLCRMPRVTFTIQSALSVISTGDTISFSGTVGEITSGNSAWKQLDFWLDSGDYILSLGAPRIYLGGYSAYIMAYDAGTRIATISGGNISSAAFTLEELTHVYIAFYIYNRTLTDDKWVFMLNTGSTALPYEPYGWAEKITNAGQTVPVYLGQTQTVRKIKKLVLTGTENVSYNARNDTTERFAVTIPAKGGTTTLVNVISTHFNTVSATSYPLSQGGICMRSTGNDVIIGTTYDVIGVTSPSDASTLTNAFKAFLAEQYTNGNPVTVWYVLATPETAIVNEPLCKIGDYADELHSTDAGVTIPTIKGQNTLTVDTDLQPSEMTITYKG